MNRLNAAAVFVLAGLFCILGCGGGGGGGEKLSEKLRIIHAAPTFGPVAVEIENTGQTSSSSGISSSVPSSSSSSTSSSSESSESSESSSSSSSSSDSSSSSAGVAARQGVTDVIRFSNLTYSDLTEYVDVVEGARRIKVRTASRALPVINEQINVESGKNYSYFLFEESGVLQSLLREDDNSEPDIGEVRVRVANYAASSGVVDVYIYPPSETLSEVTPLIRNLSFTGSSAYLGIQEGSYQLKFTTSGEQTEVLDAGILQLSAGQVASLVLLDEEEGGKPLHVVLAVDAQH